MPLSIEQNIKDRVWDEVGPKIIRVLEATWSAIDTERVAEEIFDQIWPDIYSEIKDQSDRAAQDILDVTTRRNFSR